MLCSRWLIGEPSCRFDNNIHAEVFPREFFRLCYCQNLYFFPVHDDTLVTCFYICTENTVHRIIFEEMGKGFCISKIINRNYRKSTLILAGSQKGSPYSAKTIYSKSYCHKTSSCN